MLVMMADVAALVFESISKLQSLGNNLYQTTESWNDLPRKVERLRREYGRWREQISEYGLSSNPPVRLAASFNELKRLFDDEHAKLERRQVEERSFYGWRGALHTGAMAVFPPLLGASLDDVTKTIKEVVKSLETEVTIHEALMKWAAQTISLLPFRTDHRYVHLPDLESEIYSLLDDPQGPRLILLHGGPGKGKSTLVRYIALRCNKDMGYPVIYLECGSRADILAKQLELLVKLGCDIPTNSRMNGEPVRKLLTLRLKEQKMIIVLDDVDNREFLQRMVGLCGPDVTCLVTSQRGDLCRGVNVIDSRYKTIDMGDISKDNAKKMLAAHSGFLNHEIPSHLEAIAEEILLKVGENALAITTVATAIDNARHEEVEEWEAASRHVLTLLREEESLPYTFDNKYPRSFWASMQLLFNSLTEEQKRLLILVHMCQAPSVPEEIVVFLYTTINGRRDYIPRLRKELESRHLIQIRDALEGTRKQRSWSVLSLQRTFVNEEANDDMEQMFMSLRGQSSSNTDSIHEDLGTESMTEEEGALGTTLDSEFKSTVAAMYLGEYFASKIASDMNVDVSQFSDGTERPFIEPIVRRIVRDSNRLQQNDMWDQAREVSIRFICGRQMDGEINGVNIDDNFIRTLYGSPTMSDRGVNYVKQRLFRNLRVPVGPTSESQLDSEENEQQLRIFGSKFTRQDNVYESCYPNGGMYHTSYFSSPTPYYHEPFPCAHAGERLSVEVDEEPSPYAYDGEPGEPGESEESEETPYRWSTYLDYEIDALFGFF